MKKIEKMIHQIIRFRGNIEAFLVSIEEFSRSNNELLVESAHQLFHTLLRHSDKQALKHDDTFLQKSSLIDILIKNNIADYSSNFWSSVQHREGTGLV